LLVLIPSPSEAQGANLVCVLEARKGFHETVQPFEERAERPCYVRILLLGKS
jgi:hypothetical protein